MTNSKTVLRIAPLAATIGLVAAIPLTAITQAEPASNVSAAIISQSTFDPFKVKTDPDSPIAMQLKSKTPADVVVRRHTYAVPSSTGWHKHAGPVFISVTKGTLTYYDYDDPDCKGVTIPAGEGFVDDGHGHLVRNEGTEPAEDVSVILTTEDATRFRTDLEPRTADCGF